MPWNHAWHSASVGRYNFQGSGEEMEAQVGYVTFLTQIADGWAGVYTQVFLTLKQRHFLV